MRNKESERRHFVCYDRTEGDELHDSGISGS